MPPEARSAEAGPSATRASEEAGFVGDPRSAKKKIAGDGKKSKYTGVFYKRGLWQASTRENLKRRDWGSYATEIEAARAYDARAREMGNLFSLNFPTDDEEIAEAVANLVTKVTQHHNSSERVRIGSKLPCPLPTCRLQP